MKSIGVLLLGILLGGAITFFMLRPKIKFKTGTATKERTVPGFASKKVIFWEPVEPGEANDWLKNYRVESESLWYPLRVENSDDILRGFFIDREMIETIIAQDSTNCNGIRMYLAKKTGLPKRNYCTLFVGTHGYEGPGGNPEDFGTFYDYVDPCPTNCGSSIEETAAKKMKK
jgi:hypothetical protein